MPVMLELSQCIASASALMGIGSAGLSVLIAIDCCGDSPISDRIAHRRRLSSMKIRQNRPHASRAGVLVRTDGSMAAKVARCNHGEQKSLQTSNIFATKDR